MAHAVVSETCAGMTTSRGKSSATSRTAVQLHTSSREHEGAQCTCTVLARLLLLEGEGEAGDCEEGRREDGDAGGGHAPLIVLCTSYSGIRGR